jgi:hypothetical protein
MRLKARAERNRDTVCRKSRSCWADRTKKGLKRTAQDAEPMWQGTVEIRERFFSDGMKVYDVCCSKV